MHAMFRLVIVTFMSIAASPAVDAAPRCAPKTADGTGANEKVARFQAYEGVLKSVGLSTWSQWMFDGTTPGFKVGRSSYTCRQGAGLGVSCRVRTTVCRI